MAIGHVMVDGGASGKDLLFYIEFCNYTQSLFNRSSPDIAGYLSRVLKIELCFSCNIIFMT